MRPRATYNTYGLPGLIDMPSAESAPDGELSITNSYFAATNRTTLSFQILPRLTGSFRYSYIGSYLGPGRALYDRSFDLKFRILDEGRYRPAVAIGLQDFIGTGAYAGEYIVATKNLGYGVKATGGLGWGRLASSGGFSNPLSIFGQGFNTRPARNVGLGGTVAAAQWFRGNAAAFGGIEWQATDRLTFKAEYSSDAYTRETANGQFTRASPFNFGVSYAATQNIDLSAAYLYGDTLGVQATFHFNPKRQKYPSQIGDAPYPVNIRTSGERFDQTWLADSGRLEAVRSRARSDLANEGLLLESLELEGTRAEIRIRNQRFDAPAQAIGRTVRLASYFLPASVETITVIPVERGIATSSVTIQRSDLEELEFAPDGAWQSYARADISDASASWQARSGPSGFYPRFTWGLGPYFEQSLFDPDAPFRGEVGVRASASYEPWQGFVLSGAVEKSVIGNIATATRMSNSVLPKVRSDAVLYARQGDPAITNLTVAQYFKFAPDIYGRVTAGYLEPMFGGVSAEVLWKPVDSRLGFGVEVNYAQQRNFDQLFGFQNYGIVTGHASTYYELPNDFHVQLDVGRYLAGDYGGTLSVEREFDNGWRVGAFATLTDVPFSQFGEGSFDKGITLNIPFSALLGQPSRGEVNRVIRPITRDGGARLEVDGRLYDTVRGNHGQALRESWGLFQR